MTFTIFHILAILGVLSIVVGTLIVSGKKVFRRRYTYPLLILGGVFLEIYSIYIGDLVFIVLQAIFIVTSVYGLIKIHEKHGKN